MIIRVALVSDGPAIQVLLDQLGYPVPDGFTERKIELLNTADNRILVCESAGNVVGFASLHCLDMFYAAKRMGRITAICIDEKVRDQGFGGLLLIAAEQFFLKNGCDHVEVTTNLKRLITPSFYLKHGYTEDSRRFVKRI